MSHTFSTDLQLEINSLELLVKVFYQVEDAEPRYDWNGSIAVKQVVTAHDSEDFAGGTDVTGRVNRDIVADMIDRELRELKYDENSRPWLA